MYEGKAKQADIVNQKLITKYENLQKFIHLSEASESEILASLPKVQITQFIEDNRADFEKIKAGCEQIKNQMQQLDAITDELRIFFTNINYNDVAHQFLKNSTGSKDALIEQIFSKSFKLIESFNEKAKTIEQEAERVGAVSAALNQKNKGDENNKKEFEVIMGNFNDVNNLFR